MGLSILAIVSGERIKYNAGFHIKRPQRSFEFISPQEHFELWTESNLNILFPPQLDYFHHGNPDRSIENNSIGKYLLY